MKKPQREDTQGWGFFRRVKKSQNGMVPIEKSNPEIRRLGDLSSTAGKKKKKGTEK